MKIQLVLEIDYDISAQTHAGIDELTTRDELEAVLTTSVERLVGEGGLSGDTLATVNSWELSLGATVAGEKYDFEDAEAEIRASGITLNHKA